MNKIINWYNSLPGSARFTLGIIDFIHAVRDCLQWFGASFLAFIAYNWESIQNTFNTCTISQGITMCLKSYFTPMMVQTYMVYFTLFLVARWLQHNVKPDNQKFV